MSEAATRRILVVEFSQSGQLLQVMDQVIAPLQQAGHQIERLRLELAEPFPFPWPFWLFMDTFAETAALVPRALQPWQVEHDDHDLVILAYPIWFLAPPPPIVSFIKSDDGRALLKGKPVVTLTACRNMWIQAHKDMQGLLAEAGARHLDHVAMVDPAHAMLTLVTTPRWVLTGRREAFWFFPRAGVSEQQIAQSARFGRALNAAIADPQWQADAPMLTGLGAVAVDPGLAASEKIAKRSFKIWGALMRAVGPPAAKRRRIVLVFYTVFLITLLCTVVPLSMVLRAIFFKLAPNKVAKLRAELELPSGSETHRMGQFE